MSLKRFAGTVLMVTSMISLTGCAIGFNAPTNQQGPSGNGVSVNVGALEIRNATLVADPKDPNRAVLVATLINTGSTQEVLKAVTAPNLMNGQFPYTNLGSGLELRANQSTLIGDSSTNSVQLRGFQSEFVTGAYVDVTFEFEQTESQTLSLLVNPNDGIYADVPVN